MSKAPAAAKPAYYPSLTCGEFQTLLNLVAASPATVGQVTAIQDLLSRAVLIANAPAKSRIGILPEASATAEK